MHDSQAYLLLALGLGLLALPCWLTPKLVNCLCIELARTVNLVAAAILLTSNDVATSYDCSSPSPLAGGTSRLWLRRLPARGPAQPRAGLSGLRPGRRGCHRSGAGGLCSCQHDAYVHRWALGYARQWCRCLGATPWKQPGPSGTLPAVDPLPCPCDAADVLKLGLAGFGAGNLLLQVRSGGAKPAVLHSTFERRAHRMLCCLCARRAATDGLQSRKSHCSFPPTPAAALSSYPVPRCRRPCCRLPGRHLCPSRQPAVCGC